jgi:hypothetical protein
MGEGLEMRANRIDNNQTEIIQALEQVGATVQRLNAVKNGCPDILVGYKGVNYIIEIKSPGGLCTTQEAIWITTWKGRAFVVKSIEEAYKVIGFEVEM